MLPPPPAAFLSTHLDVCEERVCRVPPGAVLLEGGKEVEHVTRGQLRGELRAEGRRRSQNGSRARARAEAEGEGACGRAGLPGCPEGGPRAAVPGGAACAPPGGNLLRRLWRRTHQAEAAREREDDPGEARGARRVLLGRGVGLRPALPYERLELGHRVARRGAAQDHHPARERCRP